jgi:hypothetical protein
MVILVPGMRIDGVSKGKTAEKIGLKAVMFYCNWGIINLWMFKRICRRCSISKKGNAAKLLVSREGKEMSFDVQF